MLMSKSNYFYLPKQALDYNRRQMRDFLFIQGYSFKKIEVYQRAFDYFCNNPSHFDGATIVKDMHDIPGLDLNAMLHDYHYKVYKVGCSGFVKFFADYLYAKEMERLGKAYLSWFNFILLLLSSFIFVPYCVIRYGHISRENEEKFAKDYKILK